MPDLKRDSARIGWTSNRPRSGAAAPPNASASRNQNKGGNRAPPATGGLSRQNSAEAKSATHGGGRRPLSSRPPGNRQNCASNSGSSTRNSSA